MSWIACGQCGDLINTDDPESARYNEDLDEFWCELCQIKSEAFLETSDA